MAARALRQHAKTTLAAKRADRSQTERATRYVEEASRVRLQDVTDNPGARVMGRQVSAQFHNQAGRTIGELQRAAKPPLGWVWGNWFQPWHRLFPGERSFNGDINLRREYVPLSLLELQRLVDLNWLRTNRLIDLTQLCNTKLINVRHEWRQFGIHLTDEGADIFAAPVNIEVQWASQTTIAAVERAGGRIRVAYYDQDAIEAAAQPEAFFRCGMPVPRRKRPPHSLFAFYTDPINRGYLADDDACEAAAAELARIVGYERAADALPAHVHEQKSPDQIFLGIEPGSVVSLADKKVFRPTHPTLRAYYGDSLPLADHMR